MTPQLIVLLVGVAIFVTLVTVAALQLEKRDVASREAMWREIAARRGGRHHPGVWGNGGWRTSPVLELGVRGARVTVDTWRVGASDNSEVFTRVRAPYLRGGPSFEVCVPGLLATPGRVALGDGDGFDQDFAVRTDTPAAVASVWTTAARAHLRQRFRGGRTRVSGDPGGVALSWQGEVRDPAVIEAAIEIVADLVGAA